MAIRFYLKNKMGINGKAAQELIAIVRMSENGVKHSKTISPLRSELCDAQFLIEFGSPAPNGVI